MPLIKTTVDDHTYARLARMRLAEGVPSISALFLRKCGVATDDGIASDIAQDALVRAKKLPNKYTFKLSDLFSDAEWEGFPKGARLRAGRAFFERIAAARDGIRPSHKSSSNHQFYVVA
jgi:hypothetical protein